MLKGYSKYRSKPKIVDGIFFHSTKEANRYIVLKALQNDGKIHALRLQVPYVLQEKFKFEGKVIRKIKYVADFVYLQDGKEIIEDCKGIRTYVYKLKRKLFLKKIQPGTIFLET